MRIPAVIILLMFYPLLDGISQPDFRYHDQLFNYYLTNDLDLAEKELILQSTVLNTKRDSVLYGHNKAAWSLKKNDLQAAESWLAHTRILISDSDANLYARQLLMESTLLSKKAGFGESIRLLGSMRDRYNTLDAYNRAQLPLKLGNAYFRTGNIDSARFFSTLSLAASDELLGLEQLQVRAGNYTLQGEINLFTGSYDTAYGLHLKALSAYKASNNLFGTASALSSIAGVMLFQENYRKALGYYQQALPYYMAVHVKPYDVFNNIGATYEKLCVTDSAFFYYKMAYDGALLNGRIDLQANAAGGLGNLFALAGDHDSSIVYYRRANELFGMLQYDYGLVLCEIGLAKEYLALGDLDQAEQFCGQALQRAINSRSDELIKQGYEISYLVDNQAGRYEDALRHYENLSMLKDSLSGENISNRISELEVQYGTEIKRLENEQLRTEMTNRDERHKTDRMLAALAGLSLVALLLVLFFFYLGQKRKLRIREVEVEQVKLRNDLLLVKLNASKDAILQKNKMIEELEKNAANPTIDYTAVSKQLLEKINATNEWAEFMIEFNLLYKSFYSRLGELTTAPLSKNEMRLAALIKLNLSNKEISDLLNISVDAVKKAKNRLFKKFDLDEEGSVINLITEL